MSFWLAVFSLTGFVAWLLCVPLWRRVGVGDRRHLTGDDADYRERGRKRDLKRDLEAGGGFRRILTNSLISGVVVCVLVLSTVVIYSHVGVPLYPDQPLAARLNGDPADQPLGELVARAELKLSKDPDNLVGWKAVAPLYRRFRQFTKLVSAYRNIIRIEGWQSASGLQLAEAIVWQNDGRLTSEARGQILRVLKGDDATSATVALAQFYLALAAEQDGKLLEAKELLAKIISASNERDGWYVETKKSLERIDRLLDIQPKGVK